MLRALRRQVGFRVHRRHAVSSVSSSRNACGVGELDLLPARGHDTQNQPAVAHSKPHFPWSIGHTNGTFSNLRSTALFGPQDDFSVIKSHAYSSTAKKEEEVAKDERSSDELPPRRLEDFQHEEIVGPTVDRDTSPVAEELRKAHVEMREAIQKFAKAVMAVGAVHLVWGGMMFRAMDSPLNHALMTQVCASALVLFGLAYYSRQTLKPVEFFTRLEERSRLRILTLSLQVTRTMSSFFQRGYGVALVMFLALAANLVGCLKVFYGFW